jgi:hypothetical protein
VRRNMQDLKIELLQLLEEKKRRQEIEFAQRSGGIVVHNRDGSVTVVRIQFVEAINGRASNVVSPEDRRSVLADRQIAELVNRIGEDLLGIDPSNLETVPPQSPAEPVAGQRSHDT